MLLGSLTTSIQIAFGVSHVVDVPLLGFLVSTRFDFIDLRSIILDAVNDLSAPRSECCFAVAVPAMVARLAADERQEQRRREESEPEGCGIPLRVHVDVPP